MKYKAKKKSAVKASILMFFCTLGLCCGAFPLLPTKLTHPKTHSKIWRSAAFSVANQKFAFPDKK